MHLRIMLLAVCVLLSVGSVSVGLESGIVGGHKVKPHSRPYMASLQCRRHHKCGGMLIKNNYVLTTKHCVDDTCKILEVVLGAHNISQTENSQQIVQVEKYIKHPTNDIMLLKLKTKAIENGFVKVVDLQQTNESIPVSGTCTIAGWGMVRPGGTASSVLREVTLQLQPNRECEKKWGEHFNTEKMICTASDGKKAFCQGDSGSPLFCKSKLLGMAAYTYPNDCANKEYPEVYVKIPAFIEWIEQNME